MTKRIYLSATLFFAVAFGLSIMTATAYANPLRFPPAVSSASATTTPTYLGTATATTTLATYDTYANNGVSGGGSTQAMDKVAVLLQTTASSTSSVYFVSVQHSQDGIDWYEDETFSRTATGPISITSADWYSFTAQGTAVENRVIAPSVPLRYVRVQAKVSGAAGAIWASIQPQKQNN